MANFKFKIEKKDFPMRWSARWWHFEAIITETGRFFPGTKTKTFDLEMRFNNKHYFWYHDSPWWFIKQSLRDDFPLNSNPREISKKIRTHSKNLIECVKQLQKIGVKEHEIRELVLNELIKIRKTIER